MSSSLCTHNLQGSKRRQLVLLGKAAFSLLENKQVEKVSVTSLMGRFSWTRLGQEAFETKLQVTSLRDLDSL